MCQSITDSTVDMWEVEEVDTMLGVKGKKKGKGAADTGDTAQGTTGQSFDNLGLDGRRCRERVMHWARKCLCIQVGGMHML